MVSGVFEQCAVLFNIGSLQTHIAKSQNFDSDEGIKNACKHFQVSVCDIISDDIIMTMPLGCLRNIPTITRGCLL